MLVEETGGAVKMEALELIMGRDESGSLKLGIALAPSLVNDATYKFELLPEILKQRRKAREEAASASGRKE